MTNSIAKIADIHKHLSTLTSPRCILQKIMDHRFGCGAANQPNNALDFQTYISLTDLYNTDRYDAFKQGFSCIVVNLRAVWGGCNYDGTKLEGTQTSIHILDRTTGGMALKTWESNPMAYSNNNIELDGVVGLILSLLQPAEEN